MSVAGGGEAGGSAGPAWAAREGKDVGPNSAQRLREGFLNFFE